MTATRKRLIVHIGTQKTGSTSLQRSLHESFDALAQVGVRYAALDRSGRALKHVSVLRAARSPNSAVAQAEFNALMSELATPGIHTLIVSEERLWKADQTPLSFFARFRPECEVVVAVCLRRQDLYIESLYNQTIRTGLHTECRPIAEFWRDPEMAGRLDYHQLLSAWRTVADRVVAIDFGTAVKADGAAGSFVKALGIPLPTPLQEFAANPSPDANAVLAIRLMRERQIVHESDALIGAARMAGATHSSKPLRHLLGRTERQALLDSVSASNQALQRDFGIVFEAESPREGLESVTRPTADYLVRLVGSLSLLASPQAQTAEGSGNRLHKRRRPGLAPNRPGGRGRKAAARADTE